VDVLGAYGFRFVIGPSLVLVLRVRRGRVRRWRVMSCEAGHRRGDDRRIVGSGRVAENSLRVNTWYGAESAGRKLQAIPAGKRKRLTRA
jgi:hypothetical protein